MKSKISLATTETELEQWDQVVYWLVITGKNSQMNKTKEKQWLFVWETIKISHETTGFARRGVPCYVVVLFNTGNNSTRETKDDEVEEPRPHVESPLPFTSFLLYRKIVPKRTSKRPQSLEDGHWGRCRTQTTALTVCHFVFPNFLVWKWSEEKRVVGSKQTLSASLRFDKILFNQENEQEFSCSVANIFIR